MISRFRIFRGAGVNVGKKEQQKIFVEGGGGGKGTNFLTWFRKIIKMNHEKDKDND